MAATEGGGPGLSSPAATKTSKASPRAVSGAVPAKKRPSSDFAAAAGSGADKSEGAGAAGEKPSKKRARPKPESKDEGDTKEGKKMKLRLTGLHLHYCSLMCSLSSLH